MKRLLVILAYCFSFTGLNAQLGVISNPGIIDPYTVSAANQFFNGRLNCVPNTCISVLPVKILLFEGKRLSEAMVELTWQTTNEINNSGFEVERSLGNASHFEKIDFVPANTGPSAIHNYNLTDANNFPGISFYRLKQVDNDGRHTYSRVIAVKGYERNTDLVIYPNPARAMINLSFESTAAATGNISIYDMYGRIVLQQRMSCTKGLNMQPIQVDKLAAGTYIIKVEINGRLTGHNVFVKQQ